MKHLKLFFACLLMAVLSIGQVWGATVEVISTLNLSSTTQITSQRAIVSDILYISGEKNNANQAPTFNVNATSGTDLRFYRLASGKSSGYSTFTFSVADGYKLDEIVFKKNTTTASTMTNISAGTGTLTNNTWSPTANTTTKSVTFSYNVANSGSNFSGQIFQIHVTYSSTSGGSTEPTVSLNHTEIPSNSLIFNTIP